MLIWKCQQMHGMRQPIQVTNGCDASGPRFDVRPRLNEYSVADPPGGEHPAMSMRTRMAHACMQTFLQQNRKKDGTPVRIPVSRSKIPDETG